MKEVWTKRLSIQSRIELFLRSSPEGTNFSFLNDVLSRLSSSFIYFMRPYQFLFNLICIYYVCYTSTNLLHIGKQKVLNKYLLDSFSLATTVILTETKQYQYNLSSIRVQHRVIKHIIGRTLSGSLVTLNAYDLVSQKTDL